MTTPVIAKFGFAALCIMAGASCATGMSEDQCASADWLAVGTNDGRVGAPLAKFDERASQCAEFGLPPDASAWRGGYDRGLASYCTPESGFDAGSAGGVYEGVCPAELEVEFLEEFNIGARLYALTTEYESAVKTYEDALASLARHRRDLRGARNRYADDNLANEDRSQARQDVDYHRREIERLEYDLPQLELDIDRSQGRLDDYRAFLDRQR